MNGAAALREVHVCPKCGGQGHVSKPPWVAGDVDQWLSHNTGGHLCQVCLGIGYIALPATAPSPASAKGNR